MQLQLEKHGFYGVYLFDQYAHSLFLRQQQEKWGEKHI